MIGRERSIVFNSFQDKMCVPLGECDDGTSLLYSPLFERFAFQRSYAEDEESRGGILVAPSGWGKNVVMLGLIATSPHAGPTLVVCPPRRVSEWKDLSASLTPSLTCATYVRMTRTEDHPAPTETIVVTNYKVAGLDSWIESVAWTRVVFDCSDEIKSQDDGDVYAAIRAPRRWAVTNDPLANKADIRAQLAAVLGCTRDVEWNVIPRALQLLAVQPPVMMDEPSGAYETTYEELVVPFPTQVSLRFAQWQQYEKGSKHHLCRIAAGMLLPAPEDAILKLGTKRPSTLYLEEECSICFCTYEEPLTLGCGHVFCDGCIRQAVEHRAKCPLCRATIKSATPIAVLNESSRDDDEPESSDLAFDDYRVRRAMELVGTTPDGEKIVIMSHFGQVIRSLKNALAQAGVSCVTLDNTVSKAQRSQTIDDFVTGTAKVLVLNIRLGEYNLTAANHLILCEPTSDRLRTQAIECLARFGQTRDVSVRTLTSSEGPY